MDPEAKTEDKIPATDREAIEALYVAAYLVLNVVAVIVAMMTYMGGTDMLASLKTFVLFEFLCGLGPLAAMRRSVRRESVMLLVLHVFCVYVGIVASKSPDSRLLILASGLSIVPFFVLAWCAPRGVADAVGRWCVQASA